MNENVRSPASASARAARLRMNSMIKMTTVLMIASAALVSCFASASFAAPPPPPGTIYYGHDTTTNANQMAGNGTAKTPLGVNDGLPSRSLHGGQRWFLRRLASAGDFDVHGVPRYDVYAERGDGGLTVRLTYDPTMDYNRFGDFNFDWAPDENQNWSTVFGYAFEYMPDGITAVPGSGGIYSALLLFDGSGNVTGLTAEPTFLVSIGVTGNLEYPNARNRVSFSPDMTTLVSDRRLDGQRNQLVRVTVPGGVVTNLVTDAGGHELSAPQWSPSGTKIAFDVGNTASDARTYIDTVSSTGTGRISLISSSTANLFKPYWSPDSNFVAYNKLILRDSHFDIFRVTSTATGNVNLTADVRSATLLGWRP